VLLGVAALCDWVLPEMMMVLAGRNEESKIQNTIAVQSDLKPWRRLDMTERAVVLFFSTMNPLLEPKRRRRRFILQFYYLMYFQFFYQAE
jgi:hypothetical protein